MPVNESNTIQYTVVTSRVPDGTTLYWKTTGNTTNSDIVGGNTGSITITNNRAVFNVTIAADQTPDGTKTLGITLLTGSINGTSVATTPTPIVIEDTSTSAPTVSVDYLVVAGGGTGGDNVGGGGGAGGVTYGTAILNVGSSYVVTVGAGGSPTPGSFNQSGSPSSLTHPISGTVSLSYGGGYGSNYQSQPTGGGGPGGSGGGSNGYRDPNPGTPGSYNLAGLAIGSPSQGVAGTQGYPGGNGFYLNDPGGPGPSRYLAGGGGGATATGGNAGPGGPAAAGPGGAGYTWPFNGNTYGGGGGGAAEGNSPRGTRSPGSGGPGGGGSAGSSSSGATSGTTNTGGGGGGSYFSGPSGGLGGSGIVILAIPTPQYPGSAPGATVTTPPAAPGKTIVTFTSSGTYTA